MDPEEYNAPEWNNFCRVHNWHNYVSQDLRDMWHAFTEEQKKALAENAEFQANQEQWD